MQNSEEDFTRIDDVDTTVGERTATDHDHTVSEDSFVSTRPPPPPPQDQGIRSLSHDFSINDTFSDNDSYNSVLPTPNLNQDGRFVSSPPSRKTSLRFKIPNSSNSDSTVVASPSHGHHNHNKIGSPFMDENIIMEDDVLNFTPPQSPFVDSFSQDNQYASDDKTLNNSIDRKETVMKRHRWGTRRNKKGRPHNESLNRSKTLKGILRSQSILGSKKDRNRSSNNTANNSDNNSDTDDDNEPLDPRDFRRIKRSIVFNKPLPEDFMDPETGEPLIDYPRNKIRTTKYTPISFLPKNIFNQFIHNIANVYFLFLVILGAFNIFGVPSPVLSAVPLIVIVIITAIKDAIEDSRRTVTDLEVNNQPTHILQAANSGFEYKNINVNDESVSLWRRFKKMNSRALFSFIYWCQATFTKLGRAQKLREKAHENFENENLRKSFDSEFEMTYDLEENPFGDGRTSAENDRTSAEHGRKSFGDHIRKSFNEQVRKSFQSIRKSTTNRNEKSLKFAKKYWKDVKVGDIIRVYNNEEFPGDIIILSTSDEDNCCFVETKNLDGETNLKVKQALKYGTHNSKIKKADDLVDRHFQVDSEGPHPNLYTYQGNLKYMENDQEEQESIGINNLLLRGCTLRNTKWVVGIVAFTGSDTKIMLNAGITPTKQSRISHELNYYVILNFIVLFIICFVSGLINGLYYRESGNSREYFEFGTVAGSPAKNGVVSFFVALILYQSLVPISLYITIEIIKTAQAFFIYSDVGMYYDKLDYPCTAKSWSISDDLGQIEYIFSDKTGTLTQNVMEFKKCTINGVSYGRAYTEALAGLRKRLGYDVETEAATERKLIEEDRKEMVHHLREMYSLSSKYDDELAFVSSEFIKDLRNSNSIQAEKNDHFMTALALCHSVLIEVDPKDPNKALLKAQSPDEAALVGTARGLGYVFEGNTKKGLILNTHGKKEEFQVLNTLEFNSTRKRMSVIIKIPGKSPSDEPKALLICKGADSIIYDRLSRNNNPDLLTTTSKQLEEFATEGLRTLCIAERELNWKEYSIWNRKYQEAASSLEDRDEKVERVADSIERELMLLGGTAIEDRLQDGVPESIAILGNAGIKLWVLTGDKVETAINIGFSCNLLGNDMELLVLKSDLLAEEFNKYQISPKASEGEIIDQLLTLYLSNFNMDGSIEELELAEEDHSPPNEGFGVVIDGNALKVALLEPEARRKFLLLCKQCKSVLCCRVSPAQKAAVVKLVKDTLDVMTLAIGDGSNDVAMIQTANVGIGIAGEEGRQAAMSSDYAIGQFRFLVRLLLTHGRWSYKRFSEMIPSFFYKNVIFSFALFWYSIFNNFDGTYLFEFTYLTFYNLAFTSLPVIFLAVFDQDVDAKTSLLVPQLYKTGILRTEWSQTKFWIYMVDGIYQSAVSFFYPYFMYYIVFASMDGLPIDHRYWMGVVVVSISCISCNLYILFHQYRWDWLSSLIVAISILIVYGWTGIWTAPLYSGEFYKAAPQMYGQPSYWACTFIGVLTCMIPRVFYDIFVKLYRPGDVDIIRECVRRGDFDAYPENYDPTDPDRPKISSYSDSNIKRISMSTRRYTKDFSGDNSYQSGDEIKLQDAKENTKLKELQHPPSSRQSRLDFLKRQSKAISSVFDSNSFIENYNFSATTDDLTSIRTEEIPMEEFNTNRKTAQRISLEKKRFS